MSDSRMMELIKSMEGKGDRLRQEILMQELNKREWLYLLQSYVYAEEEGQNVIVDVVHQDRPETVLLVAHYDRFFQSPAANDDASACAIMIDVAEKLRGASLNRNVRMVFFDDEEPTINWRYPIGSRHYVEDFGTQGLHAVVNLELNGMGDAIGVWPVEGVEGRPILKEIASVIEECKIPFDFGKRIPGFYADYLPFRDAGFPDAYCLTTFHWKERKTVFGFGEASRYKVGLRYFLWKALRLQTVPTIFQHYHTAADSSQFISENTLGMMSELVYKIIIRLAT
jgi:Zn-dependent M28 family amino/carboxypeptidase